MKESAPERGALSPVVTPIARVSVDRGMNRPVCLLPALAAASRLGRPLLVARLGLWPLAEERVLPGGWVEALDGAGVGALANLVDPVRAARLLQRLEDRAEVAAGVDLLDSGHLCVDHAPQGAVGGEDFPQLPEDRGPVLHALQQLGRELAGHGFDHLVREELLPHTPGHAQARLAVQHLEQRVRPGLHAQVVGEEVNDLVVYGVVHEVADDGCHPFGVERQLILRAGLLPVPHELGPDDVPDPAGRQAELQPGVIHVDVGDTKQRVFAQVEEVADVVRNGLTVRGVRGRDLGLVALAVVGHGVLLFWYCDQRIADSIPYYSI